LDAGGQNVPVAHRQIQIVQPLQQAVRGIIGQLGQVVPVGVGHNAAGHLHELFSHVPGFHGAMLPRQGLRYNVMVFLPQLPQVGCSGTLHRAGVRHIKNIRQTGLSTPVLADQSNALGAGLDPSAHGAVPQVHAGAGSSVRALGVDKQLLIERIAEHP